MCHRSIPQAKAADEHHGVDKPAHDDQDIQEGSEKTVEVFVTRRRRGGPSREQEELQVWWWTDGCWMVGLGVSREPGLPVTQRQTAPWRASVGLSSVGLSSAV